MGAAVRIHDDGALAADDVMVIVADAGFVERGIAFGLDFSQDAAFRERGKVVVDGLFGGRRDFVLHETENPFGIGMRVDVERFENAKPRGRDAEPLFCEQIFINPFHLIIMT